MQKYNGLDRMEERIAKKNGAGAPFGTSQRPFIRNLNR